MLRWTDKLVKEFAKIYTGSDSDYLGLTIDEKLEKFKGERDNLLLYEEGKGFTILAVELKENE